MTTNPTTNAPAPNQAACESSPDTRLCAIGYVRVSTREQGDNGHGLDAQETAIRAAAERKGWHLAGIEQDIISTRRRSRPGLEEAIRQARECGGVLLAAKASRIARSTVELIQLHDRAGKEGWHILALDMESVDTTSPMGRMMLTVLAAFNEFEREMISERTREGLAAAKAKGVHIGRPRLGERADNPNAPEPTPEQIAHAAAVKIRLTELRAAGLSYQAMSDALNDDGLPGFHGGRWHKQSVHLACKRYGIS